MIIAYNDSFEKYNIEDGNFRTDEEISKSNRRDIEEFGITLYDNFYIEKGTDQDNTLRIFLMRDQVNLLCLMKGAFPQKSGEMVIDRMYADNNSIKIGDTVRFGREEFKVTGFAAFPDYSALFQDNNDAMFDAVKFGIAAVRKEDFEKFPNHVYRRRYGRRPGDDADPSVHHDRDHRLCVCDHDQRHDCQRSPLS